MFEHVQTPQSGDSFSPQPFTTHSAHQLLLPCSKFDLSHVLRHSLLLLGQFYQRLLFPGRGDMSIVSYLSLGRQHPKFSEFNYFPVYNENSFDFLIDREFKVFRYFVNYETTLSSPRHPPIEPK